MSAGLAAAGAGCPVIAARRPSGHDDEPAEDHRRQGRDLRLAVQLREALLEPGLEVVGAAARLLRVEPRAGLAGLLLKLELLGAVVPVGDLLGEAVLHGGAGLVDPAEAPAAHLRDVLGHDVRDGVAERLLLEVAGDPGALGAGEEVVDRRLALGERPVVEVGRVVQMARVSRRRPSRRRASAARSTRRSPEGRRLASWMACSRVKSTRGLVPGSRSSTRTVPRLRRSRWRSSVRSRTASSSGWPGQTKAASGWPCGRDQLLLEGDPLVALRAPARRRRSAGRGCAPAPGRG